MGKTIIGILLFAVFSGLEVPEVKVAGAMKNIMMNGDLSAHVNLDTLDKSNLFGLGPVPGLKGEILILDGIVYTSSKKGNQLINKQNDISKAAMLVYSKVEKWKPITIHVSINNFAELEKLIEATARANDYDTAIPFAFKIEAIPEKASYHVIDWKDKATHTMDNHKQFAYLGKLENSKSILLGFYSTHHQSIFTHHTTYVHIHLLEEKTKTVGHLDDIQLKGRITIYLPEI